MLHGSDLSTGGHPRDCKAERDAVKSLGKNLGMPHLPLQAREILQKLA
jgi:hypothetical protein